METKKRSITTTTAKHVQPAAKRVRPTLEPVSDATSDAPFPEVRAHEIEIEDELAFLDSVLEPLQDARKGNYPANILVAEMLLMSCTQRKEKLPASSALDAKLTLAKETLTNTRVWQESVLSAGIARLEALNSQTVPLSLMHHLMAVSDLMPERTEYIRVDLPAAHMGLCHPDDRESAERYRGDEEEEEEEKVDGEQKHVGRTVGWWKHQANRIGPWIKQQHQALRAKDAAAALSVEQMGAVDAYCFNDYEDIWADFVRHGGRGEDGDRANTRLLACALRSPALPRIPQGVCVFEGQGMYETDICGRLATLCVGDIIERLRPSSTSLAVNPALHFLGSTRADKEWLGRACVPKEGEEQFARRWGMYATHGCLLVHRISDADGMRALLRQAMEGCIWEEAEVILPPMRLEVVRIERGVELPVRATHRPGHVQGDVKCVVVYTRAFSLQQC
jgi:hypothetical protein